nr:zinc finger BED domain-containing protein DAYSLEEPER-like [Ipomoea batatas]
MDSQLPWAKSGLNIFLKIEKSKRFKLEDLDSVNRVEECLQYAPENIQAHAEECYNYVPQPARDDELVIQPQVYAATYVEKLHLLGKIVLAVIELASKPPPVVRDNENFKLMHTAAQKLVRDNIVAMDEAIMRREEYLKKATDMPSFNLGLTPPLGEEQVWADIVNISTNPSSTGQEEEQREVAEKDVVMEEIGDQVENVGGGGERDKAVDAQINVAQQLTATEKVFQGWIMQNPNADNDEYVFRSGETLLMRLEMPSLKQHAYVTASVTDVWSIILNGLERFRDPISPSRFFATAFPCNERIDIIDDSFAVVTNDAKYGKVHADLPLRDCVSLPAPTGHHPRLTAQPHAFISHHPAAATSPFSNPGGCDSFTPTPMSSPVEYPNSSPVDSPSGRNEAETQETQGNSQTVEGEPEPKVGEKRLRETVWEHFTKIEVNGLNKTEYNYSTSSSKHVQYVVGGENLTKGDPVRDKLKTFMESATHLVETSELDLYLEAKRSPFDDDLDVLSWWQTEGKKYPTLSKSSDQQQRRQAFSPPFDDDGDVVAGRSSGSSDVQRWTTTFLPFPTGVACGCGGSDERSFSLCCDVKAEHLGGPGISATLFRSTCNSS